MKYFDDPQQAPVMAFCERCGREIYHDNAQLCRRCEEDAEWDRHQNGSQRKEYQK